MSPDQWDTTNQILMLLKYCDPTDVGNKRGIGVGQPALRKIYSKILDGRLMVTLERHCSLSQTQDGFIRGCDSPLFTLSETLANCKDQRTETFCLFLDMNTAFDTVDHTLLWKKLWDAGVRGRIFRVIRELYNDLETCVPVNGEPSRSFSIRQEVLQCDVLSTTLFLVYVNGLLCEIQALDACLY